MCLVILDPGSLGGLDIPASPVYQATLVSPDIQGFQATLGSRDGLVFLDFLAQEFPVGAVSLASLGLVVSVVGVECLAGLVSVDTLALLEWGSQLQRHIRLLQL